MIEREDRAHLMFATTQRRVLYTFNVRDFYALHSQLIASSKSHAGLILVRQQQFQSVNKRGDCSSSSLRSRLKKWNHMLNLSARGARVRQRED
jgi:hypothetical protein